VVIGSKNARSTIVDCVSELERQCIDRIVELIIVDSSADGTAEIITKNFPNIKLIESTEDKFIPELWEIGINLSNGEIIAITTAHSVPDRNWIDEILKAHDNPAYVGIGGAIENVNSANLVDWAIYFCRYSPYMLPFSKMNVKDIAADNASYKKSVLDKFKHLRHQGFWESRIHSELIKCGYELLLTPDIVRFYLQGDVIVSSYLV